MLSLCLQAIQDSHCHSTMMPGRDRFTSRGQGGNLMYLSSADVTSSAGLLGCQCRQYRRVECLNSLSCRSSLSCSTQGFTNEGSFTA